MPTQEHRDQSDESPVVDSSEHSVTSREPIRQNLAADVEAFLQQGGEVKTVPKDHRADPPRKPENNYGRGSI